MYRQRVALDPILERQRHGGQKAQLGKDAPPGDKLRRLVDRCPDDVERRTAKLVGAWKRRGLDPQPPRDAARLGGDVFSIMCSCAVRARLAPVLELLLDEEDGLDADPNLATPSGLTPLHLAAEYDNFAAVACLIRHGADPEMREHAFDRQPLHMAASYAAPATVMLLVVETGRAVEAALLAEIDQMRRANREEEALAAQRRLDESQACMARLTRVGLEPPCEECCSHTYYDCACYGWGAGGVRRVAAARGGAKAAAGLGRRRRRRRWRAGRRAAAARRGTGGARELRVLCRVRRGVWRECGDLGDLGAPLALLAAADESSARGRGARQPARRDDARAVGGVQERPAGHVVQRQVPGQRQRATERRRQSSV